MPLSGDNFGQRATDVGETTGFGEWNGFGRQVDDIQGNGGVLQGCESGK